MHDSPMKDILWIVPQMRGRNMASYLDSVPRLTCVTAPRAGTAGIVVALGLIVSLSGGCTSIGEYVRNGFKVGPNYQKPPAPVASEWIDSASRGVNTAV